MDNAAIGSNLEVRLSPDINQRSVNMFLQFLYEGYMVLTEENAKDIEKIARLLQVDSIIKCCADFFKTLQEKTGLPVYNEGQYKYTSYDMLEFRHMRVSSMQKSVSDNANKRQHVHETGIPGNKRPRMQRQGSPAGDYSDNFRSSHGSSNSYDRDSQAEHGSSHGATCHRMQSGAVEIVEDGIELVQTEPTERDPVTGRLVSSRPPVQKSVSVSVSSQVQRNETGLQIINVASLSDYPTLTSQSQSNISTSSSISGNQLNHTPDPTGRPMSQYHQDTHSQMHMSSQSLPSPRTEQQKQTLSGINYQQTSTGTQNNVPSSDLDMNNPISNSVSYYVSQTKPFAVGSATHAALSPSTTTSSMSHDHPPETLQELTELSLFGLASAAEGQSSQQEITTPASSRLCSLERDISSSELLMDVG